MRKRGDVQPIEAFSTDYFTARDRFRELAAKREWKLESIPIPALGPNQEELTIDVAISPTAFSKKTIVVSSGLHGMEGLFGSAVQLRILNRFEELAKLPIRWVLVHSQNPFGFAHGRRVNEDNVDLNRNFLLESEQYEGSPAGYAELDRLLNPKKPPARWEWFTPKAMLAIARYGKEKIQQAVASGQYEYPLGLFFGGHGPSRLKDILAARLSKWLGTATEVVHLDLHTGLGDWAGCNVLVDYELREELFAQLRSWLGEEFFQAYKSHKVSYRAKGGMGHWIVEHHPGINYRFGIMEFGTYRPVPILKGLRAENQAHHWGQPDHHITRQTKEHLQELFCPANLQWREQTMKTSQQLIHQVAQGLAELSATSH